MNSLISRLIYISLLASLVTLPAQLLGKPLEVRGERFDFGHVPFGSTIKHRVMLYNRGVQLIKITRVNAGCACTQVPLTRREIAPGDSLGVDLILDTSKIRTGLFQKAPMIYTDNVESPRVTVTLTGYNLGAEEHGPRIKLQPGAVKFNRNDGVTRQVVHIQNETSQDLRPQVVALPDADIVEITMPQRVIRPHRSDSIVVAVSQAPVQQALNNESLTFYFNDNKNTRFTIPITVIR